MLFVVGGIPLIGLVTTSFIQLLPSPERAVGTLTDCMAVIATGVRPRSGVVHCTCSSRYLNNHLD